jgi:hypothetical protein
MLVCFAAVLFYIIATVVAILILNDGHFVYVMDDAYIHLALSDNIAAGHYGINPGENASPSSSVIYPAILALFSGSSLHAYAPMLLNTVACLTAVWVLVALVRLCGLFSGPGAERATAWLVLGLLVPLNLLAVAFTGMEYAPHTAVTLVILLGLIVLTRDGRVRWWLPVAIVLAPLLRFEGLSAAVAAIAVLAMLRHRRLALGLTLALVLAFGGYGLLMHRLGLPFLPSSVLLKSRLFLADGPAAYPAVLAAKFMALLDSAPLALLLVASSLVAVLRVVLRSPRDDGDMAIAGFGAFLVIAHLVAGEFMSIHYFIERYEIYLAFGAFSSFLYALRHDIRALLDRHGRATRGLFLATVAVLTVLYGKDHAVIPLASHDIYAQQYQMRRLVKDHLHADIAVNDIGMVSYRTGQTVLDLVGLASEEARRLRLANPPGWVEGLVRKHRIPVVMVYESWFPGGMPPSWTLVGRLLLTAPNVICGDLTVGIFVTDGADAPRLRAALADFAVGLPSSAVLVMADAPPPSP